MDRIFGKQISNILPAQNNNKSQSFLGKIFYQITRSNSQNIIKINNKRFNRSNNHLCYKDTRYKCNSIVNDNNLSNNDIEYLDENFKDCFKFMLIQQEKNYKLTNYIQIQPQINQKMRRILLDWLIDLHLKFKMFPSTLFISIMILDQYLNKKLATKHNLQLIGITSLYIAAKYQEIHQVPQINQLIHLTAKTFTKQQIIKMEADIILTLDFNLIMETSFQFMQPLATVVQMDDKNFKLVQYLLQISLLQTFFFKYKPSLIASSSIYLINKIRKVPQIWPISLQTLTGYSQKQLKNCTRDLYSLLQKIDQLPNMKSIKKKFSSHEFHEVTKIKISKKKL